MNIRDRLLVQVLAVWLLAAAGLALLAKAIHARETARAQAAIGQYAQTLNLVLERELDKRAALARGLGSSGALRRNDLQAFHDEASMATRGTGDWVIVVTPEFEVLNTSLPWQAGRRTRRPAGAPMASAGVLLASEGAVDGRPAIALLAPELGTAPPRYDVGIAFEPRSLQAILQGQPAPDGMVASVMDDDQRLIAGTGNPAVWGSRPADPQVGRLATRGIEGFLRARTRDGVDAIAYVTQPNRYHWTVVAARPADALAQAAGRLTLQAVAAAALLLLAALALAQRAVRRISQPVRALQESARSLRADRVPAPLRTGIRELDDISQALTQAGARQADAVSRARDAQARLLEGEKHEAIGRLAGGMAHDFNNLLQTIRTALEVLGLDPSAPPSARVLDSATRASSRAAELVRQMLAFGRAQPQRRDAIALADFLLGIRERVHEAIGPSIELVAELEPGLPELHVDGAQLELALLNLVLNARDAMHEGGHVVISARRAQGEQLLVTVCDDGPGMDETTVARAMEPYFTTKPIGTGSGLGLAQVRAFAAQSGGQARIRSAVGRGTCVELLLPIAGATGADRGLAPAHAPAGPLRILMVEDDPLVQSVVLPALEAAGHAVTLAGTGDAALVLLRDGAAIDVLFTDVVMPGRMSGLDLAAWCREHRPELAVVVATGYSAQPLMDVAVLDKPYDLRSLMGALARAVAATSEIVPVAGD